MTTNESASVLVLGATNRPNNVDDAILRRLPRAFRIALPNEAGRLQILQLTLKEHPITKEAKAFLPTLAKLTTRYSGSDIKELCRCAALEAVREVVKDTARRAVMESQKEGNEEIDDNVEKPKSKLRAMTPNDLKTAMIKVKRTGRDAEEYDELQRKDPHSRMNRQRGQNQQQDIMKSLLALSQMISNGNGMNGGFGNDGDDDEEDYADADDRMPEM